MTENTTTTVPSRKNYLADIAEHYLANGETVIVVFTKNNGTQRKMLCTRNLNVIPKDKHPKGSGKAKVPHLVVAFDLDKGEWRSFNETSVLVLERVSGHT
jgi:hypothetical protein